ncbi:MAG: class I SAM-dependent methyltransferase, partial [Acidimicrobiales bacterium]
GRACGSFVQLRSHQFDDEPSAGLAVETVFDLAGVGPGTELLDVACGSGLAVSRAERLGATTSGIDAAEGLIEIAQRRAPQSELMAGDMFALPWADDSFDVVTSFNGIWGGCDDAVAEMARVLRPGGLAAITFWGRSSELDLRDFFIVLGTAEAQVGEELMDLAQIGRPGVAEAMFDAAGLDVVTRGTTAARFEFPDDDIAWRALRSPGVAAPSLAAVGEDELRSRVLDAIAPFRAGDGSYVLQNELTHLIARLPG